MSVMRVRNISEFKDCIKKEGPSEGMCLNVSFFIFLLHELRKLQL